jgi:hypothetical protein
MKWEEEEEPRQYGVVVLASAQLVPANRMSARKCWGCSPALLFWWLRGMCVCVCWGGGGGGGEVELVKRKAQNVQNRVATQRRRFRQRIKSVRRFGVQTGRLLRCVRDDCCLQNRLGCGFILGGSSGSDFVNVELFGWCCMRRRWLQSFGGDMFQCIALFHNMGYLWRGGVRLQYF